MKFNNNFQLNKKDLEKGLKLPKEMSKELAELIGIHFGDGLMDNRHNYTYRIYYTCNISEKQYANYIINQFKKLFNVSLKLRVRKNKSCIDLYIYSKSLCKFFNEILKIPYSPKDSLSIPEFISNNKEYIKHFLRGLFDTDGCIVYNKSGVRKIPIIRFSTKHKSFAKEIEDNISNLKIKVKTYKKNYKDKYTGFDVVIYGKQSLKLFNLIGSKNIKNIKKWGRQDLNSDSLVYPMVIGICLTAP